MGDGGQAGLSTVVLDSYGRAYSANLAAGLAHAPLRPQLAPALGIGSRSRMMAGGSTAIALSVTAGQDGQSVNRLLLSAGEERRARALAGSVLTRLGQNTSLALGISRSGLALASELDDHGGSDFLVGGAALDSFGFDTRAKAGLAMRQQFGPIGLTASAETGMARLWENGRFSELRRGYREHGYSAWSLGASTAFRSLTLSARATNLVERDTVLGARFDGAFGTGGGAGTWFADLQARWTPSQSWALSAAWRQGWTRIGAGGLRPNADHLRTMAWSFDATRNVLFNRNDRLSVRIAQPLRVSRGGFDLNLPTSYDYATSSAGFSTTLLSLAPTGRERDVEAVYSRPLWGGQVSANTFWRRQPGNFAGAPDDLGAAIRFSFGL